MHIGPLINLCGGEPMEYFGNRVKHLSAIKDKSKRINMATLAEDWNQVVSNNADYSIH
jgi:hypothetical protein